MTNTQRMTVVGVFENVNDAQRAVEELRRAGFTDSQIGVASRDKDGKHASTTQKSDDHSGTGAITGALAGAGLGTAWGIGIMAGLLPAIGPVIAGGTLVAILASAGLGAAAASIGGALIGLGVPEDEAKYYESEFQAGRTVVTVKAEGRYDEALAIVRRHNAYDVATRNAASSTARAATAAPTAAPAARSARSEAGQTVQLREEELQVNKQQVEAGEVRLHKEVHTEHKTIDVPVTREEIVIERRPASGQSSAADIQAGEEIRIPVKEEQVNVEKQSVVKEEVSVGKRQVQDTERVTGEVRKEQVRVEKEGDVEIRGDRTDKNR